MMKKTILIFLAAFSLCSCYLDKNIPDPTYVALIKSLKAEGALSIKIDEKAMTVVIDMDETYDLTKVKIDSCRFNNDSLVKSSVPINGVQDLSVPLEVILTTYQDYFWTISATQNFIREFTVKDQMGESIIDTTTHTVNFGVPKSVPLEDITVLTCKLGPSGLTTYEPEVTTIHDFSKPVSVTVKYRDVTEQWTLIGNHRTVKIEQISPRAKCCYMDVDIAGESDNGIEYRKKGTEEWVPVDSLRIEEGEGLGYVGNLSPSTEYECRAFSGGDTTEIESFATTAETQLPNAGFNVFSRAEDPNYYSFFDPSSSQEDCRTKWWDNGNYGSTSLGSSYAVTVPNTEDFKEGTASIQLISRFVGLIGIGKFAAGNCFAGEFAGLSGMNGKVNFGRPFTERPSSLKFWIKYENGPIDYFNGCPKTDQVKIGDPDIGCIYISLGDWDAKTYGGTDVCPVQINTADESTFFNPDGPNVIAYGKFSTDKPTAGWTEVEIPLDYRDNFKIPTHIVISCASSTYGDYFTGSTKSRMWLDDFRLIY